VEYGKLVDIGREVAEERVGRPPAERALRWALRKVLPHPRRFGPLLALGRAVRPLAPAALRAKIPARQAVPEVRSGQGERRVLMLEGCVQPALTPRTNAVAKDLLGRLGIHVMAAPGAGCCGAVSQHLSAPGEARDFMRRNIDAWWPQVEAGAEAIVVTASGCGAVAKEYGYHLRDDPAYAEKAARISDLARDLSEVVDGDALRGLAPDAPRRIAFHAPCTLQHAQKLPGRVERLLTAAGFELVPVADGHLCCGSAGTYSILQPGLSTELRDRRLQALEAGEPALIATANVGCQTHLATAAGVPVVHWVELFARDGT
jgi:glycolate oxidase iron-sulfur subunit